ncbi:MAG: hypothetical protein AAFY57_20375, partial [Cyanobacteria bacterium J06642_2]
IADGSDFGSMKAMLRNHPRIIYRWKLVLTLSLGSEYRTRICSLANNISILSFYDIGIDVRLAI